MAKIFFLVDGFNLYHALNYFADASDHKRYCKYKWIDLNRLCSSYLRNRADSLAGIEYFTTLATWDLGKAARHKTFIKAQENQGVAVTYGEFKRRKRQCQRCSKQFFTFEEKQTDVNISIRLFQLAVQDKYDKAVLISGDTDLIPAVKAVQITFPGKEIGAVIPIGRSSEDLRKQVDFCYKMKEVHLKNSLLPDPMTLIDGTVLTCPSNWK